MVKFGKNSIDGETRDKTEARERATGEMHNTNLFDENQRGINIDESTGKPWDDTGGQGNDEKLTVITNLDTTDEDMENDEAAKWLKEHDV